MKWENLSDEMKVKFEEYRDENKRNGRKLEIRELEIRDDADSAKNWGFEGVLLVIIIFVFRLF